MTRSRTHEDPTGLTDRQLYVSVSADGRDRVKVLAQAESIWLTARPASERIPGRTHAIVIVVRHAHDVLKTITVSRHARVKRIVAAFNDVPIVQPDTYSRAQTIMRLLRNFSYALSGGRGCLIPVAQSENGSISSTGWLAQTGGASAIRSNVAWHCVRR